MPSCMNPCIFSSNLASSGFPVSALPELRIPLSKGGQEVSSCLPSRVDSPFSIWKPLLKEHHSFFASGLRINTTPDNATVSTQKSFLIFDQSRERAHSPFCIRNPLVKEHHPFFASGLGINTTPNNATVSTQKSFLVFDQSREQTRMFLSPLGSSYDNAFVKTPKPPCACPLCDKKLDLNQISQSKQITEEESVENHVISERSEMREDTEEINALLYSDDDVEDDEVTSTGHSTFGIKRSSENNAQAGERTEEFGGSSKRQKLLAGYQITSVVELDRSREDENDAQSSCASSNLDYDQSRKDKLRETLRVLGSIIPGSKSKEPSLVIDEAINYLQSMKLKAKALGVCDCP